VSQKEETLSGCWARGSVFVGGIGSWVELVGLPVREGWAIVGAIEEAVGKVAKTTKLVYCEGAELDVVEMRALLVGSFLLLENFIFAIKKRLDLLHGPICLWIL
jgi:hypothetical protein